MFDLFLMPLLLMMLLFLFYIVYPGNIGTMVQTLIWRTESSCKRLPVSEWIIPCITLPQPLIVLI